MVLLFAYLAIKEGMTIEEGMKYLPAQSNSNGASTRSEGGTNRNAPEYAAASENDSALHTRTPVMLSVSPQEVIALKFFESDYNAPPLEQRLYNASFSKDTVRAGSAKSDRGLGGGSVLPQPKMAEKRRTDEQTTSQEPHGGIQGEGGLDRAQGREDTFRTGRAI
jgi:hypothetical protein